MEREDVAVSMRRNSRLAAEILVAYADWDDLSVQDELRLIADILDRTDDMRGPTARLRRLGELLVKAADSA